MPSTDSTNLPEMPFEFSFNLIGKNYSLMDNGIFKGPITTGTLSINKDLRHGLNLNFGSICGTGWYLILKGLENLIGSYFCAVNFEIVKGFNPGIMS